MSGFAGFCDCSQDFTTSPCRWRDLARRMARRLSPRPPAKLRTELAPHWVLARSAEAQPPVIRQARGLLLRGPLFYVRQGSLVLFATQRKALLSYPGILPVVGRAGLCQLFSPQKTAGGVFREIRFLPPGSTLRSWDSSSPKDTEREEPPDPSPSFRQLYSRVIHSDLPWDQAPAGLLPLLRPSVRSLFRQDAPQPALYHQARCILRDSLQPLNRLIDPQAADRLLALPPGEIDPGLLEALVSLNYWLLHYNVYLDLEEG